MDHCQPPQGQNFGASSWEILKLLYVTVGNLHWSVCQKKGKKSGSLKFPQGVFGQRKWCLLDRWQCWANDKRPNDGLTNKWKAGGSIRLNLFFPLLWCFFLASFWIQKGPTLCFVWTLPSRLSCTLPFHPFPMPSPGPPQELQTQMCSFPFCSIASLPTPTLLLLFQMEKTQGFSPASLVLYAGWVQDGALCRVQEERCGYSTFSFQPENIPQTSALKKLVMITDSNLFFLSMIEHHTTLSNPY